MKFENTKVYNFMQALRAMRLSYNSESDSESDCLFTRVGPKDEELIKKLVSLGPSHRKFMRQILVSVDITAPRYWWTQFDTYKVGVTSCSESTMHTLMKRPLKHSDFARPLPGGWLERLNGYMERKEFSYLVNVLPQGYLQKRHVTMNYEVVRTIIEQRKEHKLGEWKELIEWARKLPHMELFLEERNDF